MSAYTYVDSVNQNLVCCICRGPFVDPCTTRTCCHTFCYECIARAMAISAQCPIDRCPLIIGDLASADPLIRNLVDELLVECPQKDVGCTHTCQRLLLAAHLRESCKYAEMPCPDGLCSARILRKDLATHVHSQEASSSSSVTRDVPHGSSADPKAGGVLVRKDDGSRRPARSGDDLRVPTGTTTTSSAPPEVRSLTDEYLEAENARLRLRLSALEGVVNVLRHELQAVRRVLGPWYRTDGASQDGVQHTSTLDPTLHPDYDIAPQSNADLHDVARTRPSGHDENTSAGVASISSQATSPATSGPPVVSEVTASRDLSSYFPPVEDEVDVYSPGFLHRHRPQSHPQSPSGASSSVPSISTNQHPHLSQRLPLSQLQSHSGVPPYAAYSPPSRLGHTFPLNTAQLPTPSVPHPAIGAISIPPLDPSTPLPNTLASMHGSIVSLAGAVGALATTRAQDALYTGEEMRNLRAGMHGLRLQLHDVLTAHATGRDSSSPPIATSVGGSAADSPGLGGMPLPGGPPAWMTYLPRPLGAPAYPYMPGGFTKL